MPPANRAPSVDITISRPGEPELVRTVEFNMGRLLAIEEQFDKNWFVLAEEIGECLDKCRGTNGKIDGAAVVKNFRLGFITRFCAACVGVPLDCLSVEVPAERLFVTFSDLLGGFIEAVNQFSGPAPAKPEDAAANPQPASAESAPDSASSAA